MQKHELLSTPPLQVFNDFISKNLNSKLVTSQSFDGDVKPTMPFDDSLQNGMNSIFRPGINGRNGDGAIGVSHGEGMVTEEKMSVDEYAHFEVGLECPVNDGFTTFLFQVTIMFYGYVVLMRTSRFTTLVGFDFI
jgi:hypothetical protein